MSKLRNEIAKRYTPRDWMKSRQVAREMNLLESDQMIAGLIRSGKPGLVGRLGGTEARFIGEFLKLEKRSMRLHMSLDQIEKFSFRWKKRRIEILNNAGFYPRDWNSIREFVSINLAALMETDVLGAWGTAFAWPESFALERPVIPRVTLIDYTAPWVDARPSNIKPGRHGAPTEPWSLALEGKSVLVVSGFSKSISKQYEKHCSIFPTKKLPKFDLHLVNVPLMMGIKSIDNSYWNDVFLDLIEKMDRVDFDVALVSAGAFSLPLAHHAKRNGKIGIHAGGALQLYFGIMGNRWNNYTEVTSLINENWTRPLPEERPTNAHLIENSCYW